MKSLLLVFASSFSLYATDWPHWRGPEFNGSSPEANLPTEFSPTNGVKWVAEMPGPASATPIISGDIVFISSTDAKLRSLLALAFDRKEGKELWRREISPGFGKDNRSNFASPSPVTDGKVVAFLYGNGALAAFDFAGRQLWARNLEKDYGQFAFQWTYGASPTLCDGKLFIQVLQRNVPVNGRGRTDGPIDSYLLALEPATGKELWRQARPSDARGESYEAYSTPIPFALYDDPGQFNSESDLIRGPIKHWTLLVAGGDCITSHDAKTGKELWRWGTWNPTKINHWRLVPSPVAGGKVAITPAPKGAPIYAVKLGSKGTLTDDALAWKSEDREVSRDVSTPAFYRGKFYVLNSDRNTLARVDPATGKSDWIGQIVSRAKIEASPTAADGKLYFLSHSAEVFVASAGDEFKLLHQVAMGDASDRETRSTIAVSDGNLFIRTAGKLYCIGK